jgi:hypothetical protein
VYIYLCRHVHKSSSGTGLNLSAFLLLASRGKHAADLHLELYVSGAIANKQLTPM